jgi:hypothetical protein
MMAHQESVTGTSLRTPRAAAAAGIVFSLLFSLALVLLLLSAPSDTATEGAWLADASNRATMAVALNLVPFAGIAFLWFIGVVRDRIGPREDRFFATVFTASTATITLRTKVIPRWIGVLGFAVAAVLLFSTGLTPWVELLFPAWILLLSIDIMRTGLRSSRDAGDTAIDTPA